MDLGKETYKFEGKSRHEDKKIQFDLAGQNDVFGKMTLEIVEKTDTSRLYRGEIKLEERGDSDDKLEGKVRIKVDNVKDVWIGEIVVEYDSERAVGEIKMTEEKVYSPSQLPSSATKADIRGYDKEDDSGKSLRGDAEISGSSGKGSAEERNFWHRIKAFFKIE